MAAYARVSDGADDHRDDGIGARWHVAPNVVKGARPLDHTRPAVFRSSDTDYGGGVVSLAGAQAGR
jgi:hypothetical protein